MGDWTIVIHGMGAHHNDKDFDAKKIAQEFVHELARKGHQIKDAKFTYGGCNDLAVKSSYPDTASENHGLRGNPDLRRIEWNGDNWPEVLRFIDYQSNMKSYAVAPDNMLTIIVEGGRKLTVAVGSTIVKFDNGELFVYSN